MDIYYTEQAYSYDDDTWSAHIWGSENVQSLW